MRRKIMLACTAMLTVIAVSAVTTAILLPGVAGGQETGGNHAGYMRRYVANFDYFDPGGEATTNVEPLPNGEGGEPIYRRTFFTAGDVNTIYVTMSATGDDHGGARGLFSCRLDDVVCRPEGSIVSSNSPAGWITLIRHRDYNQDYTGPGFPGDGGGGAGDLHDNGVYYTWCTRIDEPGSHTVQLRMASRNVDNHAQARVFIESAHFYIDGSRIAEAEDRCTSAKTPDGVSPGRASHVHP